MSGALSQPLATIITHVVREMDVDRDAFLSPRRFPSLVAARQAATWLARRRTRKSLSQIGRHFGGRDPSTIHHAFVRAIERRERDDEFRHLLDRVDALLGGVA